MATSVSAFIIAGVLAAYLFVGRSLTRLVNVQHQEVESRHTLRQMTADVSAAISLTTATSSQLVLTKKIGSGTATVTYTYSSGAGTLTRADTSNPGTDTLLTGLTVFAITYYNDRGTAVTSSPQSVKSLEFSFTAAAGNANIGTRATYKSVSPRVLLRNKAFLQ